MVDALVCPLKVLSRLNWFSLTEVTRNAAKYLQTHGISNTPPHFYKNRMQMYSSKVSNGFHHETYEKSTLKLYRFISLSGWHFFIRPHEYSQRIAKKRSCKIRFCCIAPGTRRPSNISDPTKPSILFETASRLSQSQRVSNVRPIFWWPSSASRPAHCTGRRGLSANRILHNRHRCTHTHTESSTRPFRFPLTYAYIHA